MKTYYYLDAAKLTDRDTAQDYIAAVFDFPSYYGKNLDALHDCLTELGPAVVTIEGVGAIADAEGAGVFKEADAKSGTADDSAYFHRLLCVFRDSAAENLDLSLAVEE